MKSKPKKTNNDSIGSFPRSDRFPNYKVSNTPYNLSLQLMSKRTSSSVGPGTYNCAKLITSHSKIIVDPQIKREDCYEIVENLKILNPVLLKKKDKQIYTKN
jgi:hypothetical protein